MSSPFTEKPKDVTEVLEPTAEFAVITFGLKERDTEMTFVQRPLSFFGKMEFFAVMGRALDRAMSGPDGISLADLMDAPTGASQLREADTFVRGIAKLAADSPEILGDLYCVILAVPKGYRQLAKNVMEQPPEEGGFTDEQGVSILERFVDHNWDAITAFFTQQLQGLMTRVQDKMPAQEVPSTESPSSKRSKSTPPSTPKQ